MTMGLIAACILLTLGTWWDTREMEGATRRMKRVRLEAMKRGETVLDDVVDRKAV